MTLRTRSVKFETVSARAQQGAWSGPAPESLIGLQVSLRPAESATRTLYAGGDVGSSARLRASEQQLGSDALLGELTAVLRTGDVVFANLETPLLTAVPNGAFHTGETAFARTLAEAGFNLLSLANNHIYDHGASGLASSLAAVREAGLGVVGAGATTAEARALVRTDGNGLRLGWLGAARTLQAQAQEGPHFEELDAERLCAAVTTARPSVDVLVVSVHLGCMYVDYPHPDHRALTQRLATAGADLVLLHHAHVLQGVEVLETTKGDEDRCCVVCHNLGNLLFDWQDGHVRPDVAVREQREGAVFAFELDLEGVSRLTILPTRMHEDDGRVQWALGADGARILDRLERLSTELASLDAQSLAERFHRQYAERNTGLTFRVLWHHLRRGRLGVVLPLLGRIRLRHARQLLHWLGRRLAGSSASKQAMEGRS